MDQLFSLRVYFPADQIAVFRAALDVDAENVVIKEAVACIIREDAGLEEKDKLQELADVRIGDGSLTFYGWYGLETGEGEIGNRFVAIDGCYQEWPSLEGELIAWVDHRGKPIDEVSVQRMDGLKAFLTNERKVRTMLPLFDPYDIIYSRQREELKASARIVELEFQAAGFTEGAE